MTQSKQTGTKMKGERERGESQRKQISGLVDIISSCISPLAEWHLLRLAGSDWEQFTLVTGSITPKQKQVQWRAIRPYAPLTLLSFSFSHPLIPSKI